MQTEISSEIGNKLRAVELFVDPVNAVLAEKILATSSVSTVYYTRIDDGESNLKIIKKSTPLFSYTLKQESTSENEQTDETAEEAEFLISPDFHDDDSNIEQLGKNYIASIDGLFIIDNNKPRIVPVSLHGSGDVKVSDDSMFVNVDIYPSVGNNPIPSLDDIVTIIDNLGVVSPINKVLLEMKLKEVEEEKHKIFDVCVSEGKHPLNGEDGRLENCTNKKEKLKNLDFDEFYKVNPVISVKDGDTIAIIHPPTEGEQGVNVFGRQIEPVPGKPYQFKLGQNTKYDEDDETKIIAKLDGFVNLTDSSIQVTDTFTVKGDIDFKSGNILSKGSLKVTGNVNNEFRLSLTKDIEIGGYVGDAVIEAGQNIIIRGGFLGKGKGLLKAEENIEVKFVENQKVYTRGSLTLGKEALNAQLYVKNKILTKGSSAVIVGGHAIAGDSISVYSIGNSSESETIVEVGFDYLKRNSIMDNKGKQARLRQTLEEVDKQLIEYAQMKRLNDKGRDKVRILANEHKRLIAEIEKLKEQNLKITNEIYIPTRSKVSVSGTVYPGVKIGINGRFMIVKEPLRAKTFVLSADNEVVAL